jgi:hypothetical protein
MNRKEQFRMRFQTIAQQFPIKRQETRPDAERAFFCCLLLKK